MICPHKRAGSLYVIGATSTAPWAELILPERSRRPGVYERSQGQNPAEVKEVTGTVKGLINVHAQIDVFLVYIF
jgi:hypothetical protein